ncbi:zinc finger protein 862-like [Mercenaria mercenaria]|uniref:zinc finger protein 862-like n=1 Tax=Mercenaria mercenaria TaxID=6596 RepID=UPI00234F5E59|nr:zinc finger protein 862-like [Mercenaria mercenaria]
MPVDKEDLILFRTVFYAASEELPTVKVNSLLELQRLNGASITYRNLSWDTLSEIQKYICTIIKRDLIEHIRESDFYAIMIDESTDLTVQKHLSICVRYVNKGEPVTEFLGNIGLEDGKAHTVVAALINYLNELQIDASKMVSLATDGAATMMGKKTGVGVQLKSKYSPFLIQTHCIAHRLNLAVSDSIKKDKVLEKFRDKFNSLYNFMSASSNRTTKLKKMQDLLEEPQLTIKEPHSIRWLGLRNAVAAVYDSYNSVCATLSSIGESENNTTSIGLFKYFTDYKTVLLVAFMLDIHQELADLSLQLQKQSIVFSEVEALIDGTLGKLEHFKSNDGTCLAEMKACITIETDTDGKKYATLNGEKLLRYKDSTENELQRLRESYVSCLQKNIKQRFRKEDSTILNYFSLVLEPSIVNSSRPNESEDAVEALGMFYGDEKTVTVIHGNFECGLQEENKNVVDKLLDRDKLVQEWPKLKGMLTGCYKGLSAKAVCQRVIQIHSDKGLVEFSKLCRIGLCIAITSVECERSFSTQNRLKNKFRASLKDENLDNLISIQMSQIPFISYEPRRAVLLWEAKKKRRKSRLRQEYKPRDKMAKICP